MLKSNSKLKILFQMTGSIAAYKACDVLSQLIKQGHQVQVCCSQSALQFVGPATLEGLTGRPVVSDLYAAGNMMDHIHLARWADVIVVAPATANYLNKISCGIGDDLLTTLFLAHDFKKPFLIFPAMNTAMYEHPITQKSIRDLKQIGIQIFPTGHGDLACGETGSGRLLEPAEIFQHITNALAPINNHKVTSNGNGNGLGKKILITSGGTQEPIDAVRVLTNLSTGKTGARIAEQMLARGFDVTYLHATTAKMPEIFCRQIPFTSFADIENKIQQILKTENFDAVIHAAAVSDFTNANPFAEKISSDQDLTIHLKRNPKIVNQLRAWSKNKNCKIIAFKMTANANQESKLAAVSKLFNNADVDFVVQNDISEMSKDQHLFSLYTKTDNNNQLKCIVNLTTKNDLANWFCENLSEIKESSVTIEKNKMDIIQKISPMIGNSPEVKI